MCNAVKAIYEITGNVSNEVQARINRSDDYDCYIDEGGRLVLSGEPFADTTGLTEVTNAS